MTKDFTYYENEEVRPVSLIPTDTITCAPIQFEIRPHEHFAIDLANIWLTIEVAVRVISQTQISFSLGSKEKRWSMENTGCYRQMLFAT